MTINEHLAAATAEIRGSVAEALKDGTRMLGVRQMPHAWQREFDALPEKVAEHVLTQLLRNGFQIRHLKPAGAVDVQASVTGSFDHPPFRKEVTVSLAIGDFGLWRTVAYSPLPRVPIDYAARDFADHLGAMLAEQTAPVIAAGLAELETDVFEK